MILVFDNYDINEITNIVSKYIKNLLNIYFQKVINSTYQIGYYQIIEKNNLTSID